MKKIFLVLSVFLFVGSVADAKNLLMFETSVSMQSGVKPCLSFMDNEKGIYSFVGVGENGSFIFGNDFYGYGIILDGAVNASVGIYLSKSVVSIAGYKSFAGIGVKDGGLSATIGFNVPFREIFRSL